MSVFEIAMLVCFGAAWPFSIYKSVKEKTSKGKSTKFLVIIIMGYGAGILHKIFYYYDYVVYLYAFNMLMVSVDLYLHLRNERLGRNI